MSAPTRAPLEVLRMPVSRTTTVTITVEGAPLTADDIALLQRSLALMAVALAEQEDEP